MTQKTTLFIIDPQYDFCDSNGSLYVKGAENDISRLSKMIKTNVTQIDDIHVTLDSHHLVHIGHPIFWVNSQGQHPDIAEFYKGNPTIITADDVRKGKWRAYNPGYQKVALEYVESLEKNGRYILIVWPPHCLIGSLGATIMPELCEALLDWEKQFAVVNKITKGSNMFTEHYSAVKADVEDPEDPTTMLNTKLIKALKSGNRIGVGGEALSHCVANTIRDVAAEFGVGNLKNIYLLTDACSNVTGFEKFGEDFINDMVAAGMQLSTTDKFFN
jgi:nicotinamidase/pyrazinamidase